MRWISPRHRHIGQQPLQHPVKPVFARAAGTARRADHGAHRQQRADQQQVARIDRHAEMLDPPARPFHTRRDHIGPVGNR
jgi:hypothetical protein